MLSKFWPCRHLSTHTHIQTHSVVKTGLVHSCCPPWKKKDWKKEECLKQQQKKAGAAHGRSASPQIDALAGNHIPAEWLWQACQKSTLKASVLHNPSCCCVSSLFSTSLRVCWTSDSHSKRMEHTNLQIITGWKQHLKAVSDLPESYSHGDRTPAPSLCLWAPIINVRDLFALE